MGKLSGRTCLVTGAARGIGRAIADALVREGGNVTFTDRDAGVNDVAAHVNERIGNSEGRTIGVQCDATDRGQIQAAIGAAVARFGALHIMFNNAGINRPLQFLDVTEDNWHQIMDVNAMSVLIGTQEAAKQMIKQGGGGKIINTASVASRQGYPNMAPYCASKAAVLSLTQAAARALAPHDITVNGFAPAVVLTPLWEQLDKDLVEIGASPKPGAAIDAFTVGILRGRPAKPEDITGTAIFLAGPDSDYMTGQIIMIDGGKFPV
jgi:meso-butanediol dehydrogenase/(S,S)-butanediol dehydrogenase/diacetyl reductase